MRVSWLLIGVALIALSTNASAVKLDQQKEKETSNNAKGYVRDHAHTHAHVEQHLRRRSKSNGASTEVARGKENRREYQPISNSEEDYDWIDAETSDAVDHSLISSEPVAANNPPNGKSISVLKIFIFSDRNKLDIT